MNLITVFRGLTAEEAHLVRSRLEAANFHPIVMNDHESVEMCGGFGGGTGGVLVQVPADEAEEAKEFLASGEAAAE